MHRKVGNLNQAKQFSRQSTHMNSFSMDKR